MKYFLLLLFVGFAAVSCRRNLGTNALPNSLAEVDGKPVPMESKDDLGGFILNRLLESYAAENKLFATESEIESYLARLELMRQEELIDWERGRKSAKLRLSQEMNSRQRSVAEEQLAAIEKLIATSRARSDLSSDAKISARQADRKQAVRSVREWKINRSLFEKYGGDVTSQPSGPAPFDAYREFLKEQKALGKFNLGDEISDRAFWNTFEDKKGHLVHKDALALPALKYSGGISDER